MTEKIKKPSVISVEPIGEIVGGCKQWWEIPALVTQAQRDADVAYYEPIIQQAKQGVVRQVLELIHDWDTMHADTFNAKYGEYKDEHGLSAGLTETIRGYFESKHLKG